MSDTKFFIGFDSNGKYVLESSNDEKKINVWMKGRQLTIVPLSKSKIAEKIIMYADDNSRNENMKQNELAIYFIDMLVLKTNQIYIYGPIVLSTDRRNKRIHSIIYNTFEEIKRILKISRNDYNKDGMDEDDVDDEEDGDNEDECDIYNIIGEYKLKNQNLIKRL